MIRLTLRGLRAHRLRFLLTGLAVALGVAFMAGTLIFSATLQHGFDSLLEQGWADTDVVVRAPEAFESAFGDQREPIEATLLDELLTVDGVAAGDVGVEGYAQLVDAGGDAVETAGNNPPTLGMNWVRAPALNPWRLEPGSRAPVADDEIVIDLRSARRGGFEVGDRVTVLTQGDPSSYRLVGVARWGEVETPMGATVTMFTRATAERVLGEPGLVTTISLVADDGVSQESLAGTVRAAVAGRALEVRTGDEAVAEGQADVHEAMAFFDTFLLVFALIALFVGSFIIFNTFSITIAQRLRETALLRALGASKAQVLSSVLVEAVAVAAVASLAGLAAGVALAMGLRELLAGVGLELPSVPLQVHPGQLVPAFVVGCAVTVVAAIVPARRAASVPPIAALRDLAVESRGHHTRRTAVGLLVSFLGAGSVAFGLLTGTDQAVPVVGGGAALVFLGVAVLGPVLARPISMALAAPLELRGMTGHLARENAVRNPKRTSATASALMIGVALVSVITILAASIKASTQEQIDGAMTADFIVTTGTSGFGAGMNGFSPALSQRLRALDEVETSSGLRVGAAEIDGHQRMVVGVSPAAFVRMWDVGALQGDLVGLSDVGIAVSEAVADDLGWSLGSSADVLFARTGTDALRVEAIYEDGGQAGDFLLNTHAFDRNVVKPLDNSVAVLLADGVSLDEGRAAMAPVLAPFPNTDLLDREQLKSEIGAQIDQMLNLVYALLALAIVIALIGIANTLALSIHERTRELGLLRAVGLTRGQLRAAVRWEALVISLLGTALGLVVGGAMGWALVAALADEGLSVLSVPPVQLAVIAAIAVLAGVVAAIRPSRRAARLDVLRAITTE